MKWAGILACIVFVACIDPVHGTPFYATFTSKAPASIAECDKLKPLVRQPASAVYAVSVWQREGWPLWRNTCYWADVPAPPRNLKTKETK